MGPERLSPASASAIRTRTPGKGRELVPLWPGYLYEGKLSCVDGPPGSGKTTLLCDLAARLTTGAKMPLSTHANEPRMVLLAVTEDDIDDTIVPRLRSAGANMDLVRLTDEVLQFGTADFATWLREHRYQGRPPVLLIETLVHHMRGSVFIDEASVRETLFPLVEALRSTRSACLGAKHWNKKQNAALVNRGGGSIGFNAIARSVFSCVPERAGEHVHLIAVKDGASERPLPLAFALLGDRGAVRISWLHKEKSHHPELSTTIADAVEHSKNVFANEPVILASKALQALRAGGLSQYAIEQARSILKVRIVKANVQNGPWLWIYAPGQNTRSLRAQWEKRWAGEWQRIQ